MNDIACFAGKAKFPLQEILWIIKIFNYGNTNCMEYEEYDRINRKLEKIVQKCFWTKSPIRNKTSKIAPLPLSSPTQLKVVYSLKLDLYMNLVCLSV